MIVNDLQRLLVDRRLVLASNSPRRIKLLGEAGFKFRQLSPEIDESPRETEDAVEFAQRLAREKSESVRGDLSSNEIALSGDTVVIRDAQILGKPTDSEQACHMLESLSGRDHVVCTALALSDERVIAVGSEVTSVHFNAVTRDQISEYVANGEPMDKAGAYGIQGIGSFLVDRIEGSLDNVVGLPFNLLYTLAGEFLRKLEEGMSKSG